MASEQRVAVAAGSTHNPIADVGDEQLRIA
jgi:hypothetical protein